ncbi:MAG: hypothetical protein R3C60_14710 [Parvularculaceae bacterium]
MPPVFAWSDSNEIALQCCKRDGEITRILADLAAARLAFFFNASSVGMIDETKAEE